MSPIIGMFPDPYPGEALYSVVARYEERMGDWRARATPHDLFGSSHVIASTLCPSHVATLIARLPGQMLSSSQSAHATTAWALLQEHTLLPMYAPFLPPDRLARVQGDLLGSGGPWAQARIGIKASTVAAPRWLRSCPVCAREDVASVGEPYWHREHQAAGAVVCAQHLVWLERSPIRARGQVGRHLFLPASHALDGTMQPRRLRRSRERDLLVALARSINTVLSCQAPPREPEALRAVYVRALIGQGLASPRGRICMADVFDEFLAMYPEPLLRLLSCQFTLDERCHDHWLARLLRKPHHTQHPLHHLLLQRFLELSVEDVLLASAPEYAAHRNQRRAAIQSRANDPDVENRTPDRTLDELAPDEGVTLTPSGAEEWTTLLRSPFGVGPWPCLNPVCRDYRQPVIAQCMVSWPASAHGRPLGTFTCSCGFVYKRLGADLHPEDRFRLGAVVARGPLWEQRLTELWEDRAPSVNAIARQLTVDPLTIKRHAHRLGLPLARSYGHHRRSFRLKAPLKGRVVYSPSEAEQARRRTAWRALFHANPNIPIHQLRRQDHGVYDWLYRHDRVWLRAHTPRTRRRDLGYRRVNWVNRDHHVALAIGHATADILAERRLTLKKPERITCSLLGQRTGYRAMLQQHLDKLPEASRCLETVCESWETFALRRIQWAAACYLREQQLPRRWELVRRAGIGRHMSSTPAPVVAAEVSRLLEYLVTAVTQPSVSVVSSEATAPD